MNSAPVASTRDCDSTCERPLLVGTVLLGNSSPRRRAPLSIDPMPFPLTKSRSNILNAEQRARDLLASKRGAFVIQSDGTPPMRLRTGKTPAPTQSWNAVLDNPFVARSLLLDSKPLDSKPPNDGASLASRIASRRLERHLSSPRSQRTATAGFFYHVQAA